MINKNVASSLKRTIKWYSLLWLVFFCTCVLSFYFLSGKNLFPDDDGLHQQYTIFVYTGIWIRRLLSNIFVEHIFELPMWDMSIGMGADPIMTFGVGLDPFLWISALIPLEYSEFAFDAVIAFKIYLAGLSFVLFGHSKGRRMISILAGSMVYVFSSIMYVAFSQAGFIMVFMMFPLLMIGVDRLWENKGYRYYVVILACCVIVSTYFTFMFGLLVIGYCVVRFLFEKKAIQDLGKLLARFVCYTILGISIGIGLNLSANINLTRLDRFDVEQDHTIFSLFGWGSLIQHFFSYTNREGVFWGVSSIVMISLIVIFIRRKQNNFIKILFVLYSAAFLFPIIGSLFNGMNFSTERHIFGYIFLLAYIVTLSFDDLEIFNGKVWYFSLLAGSIYLIITVLSSDIAVKISGVSLLLCCLLVGIINGIKSLNKDLKERAYLAVILLTCFLMSYAGLGRIMTPYSVPLGQADDLMTLSTGDQLLNGYDLSDSRFDRIPYSYPEVQVNSSMITGRSGFDFYHSSYNSYVRQFYNDIGSFSNDMSTYRGLRGKLYPEILCGTSFIVRNNNEQRCVKAPYSYTAIAETEDYALYQADTDTGLVYFYDDAVSYEVFDSLPLIERDELMMRYCVVQGGSDDAIQLADGYNNIEYEISDISGLEFDGNNITVTEAGGFIELSFDEISSADTILYLENITGTAEGDMYYQVAIAECEAEEIRTADFWVGISESYKYYQGPGKLLFDFGYDEDPINRIRIYINTPGHYSIKDIAVFSRTAEQLDNTIREFSTHSDMDDISYSIDGNHISISAYSDSNRYLCIAVPYSDGWSATVDGEKVDVLRANRAFMAIPIDAGDHSIELSYSTPYLKTGLLSSAVSLIVFIGITCLVRKKSKQDV